eukprot:TRINITY_DN11278_c0_g1_i2.p1 TRINITY_DN11278_c0_g1~~TRINITY_DN11278_c0_g1_i2.p1  ORF type:complete len:731 (+),score=116.44 TRINITY_DN11278_c0_g1_i2:176-2368(+)
MCIRDRSTGSRPVRMTTAGCALIDSNNDGVVDEREFVAAGGKKEDFDRYDRNKDGRLDLQELDATSMADIVRMLEHVPRVKILDRILDWAGWCACQDEHANQQQASWWHAIQDAVRDWLPWIGEMTAANVLYFYALNAYHGHRSADSHWRGLHYVLLAGTAEVFRSQILRSGRHRAVETTVQLCSHMGRTLMTKYAVGGAVTYSPGLWMLAGLDTQMFAPRLLHIPSLHAMVHAKPGDSILEMTGMYACSTATLSVSRLFWLKVVPLAGGLVSSTFTRWLVGDSARAIRARECRITRALSVAPAALDYIRERTWVQCTVGAELAWLLMLRMGGERADQLAAEILDSLSQLRELTCHGKELGLLPVLTGCLALIQVHQLHGSKTKAPPSERTIQDFKRSCRFALATYGWMGSVWLELGNSENKKTDPQTDMIRRTNSQVAQSLVPEGTDIQSEHCHLSTALDQTPAYFVAVDPQWKRVVVSIRGTAALEDVISDLACSPSEFGFTDRQGVWHQGEAHRGILELAMATEPKVLEEVRELLGKHPGFGLVLTGHSLGAGVAALLALSWVVHFPELDCFLFGCPSILSNHLAHASWDICQSLIIGDDVITRLSLQATNGLVAKLKLLRENPCLLVAIPVAVQNYNSQCAVDWLDRLSLQLSAVGSAEISSQSEIFRPAGICYWMPSQSAGCTRAMQTISGKSLDMVPLSANMVSDHFLQSYATALDLSAQGQSP